MINSIGIKDDYAIALGEGMEFYYGYETIKGGEWCFEAKVRGKPGSFKLTTSELKKLSSDPEDLRGPTDYLLTGIIAYSNDIAKKYGLSNTPNKDKDK